MDAKVSEEKKEPNDIFLRTLARHLREGKEKSLLDARREILKEEKNRLTREI